MSRRPGPHAGRGGEAGDGPQQGGGGPGDAYAAALALLTGRDLTPGELASRLRRRGFAPGEIASARRRLEDAGFLDERRTAEAWGASLARTRGMGPRRVREGLRRRLVGAETARGVAEGLFPPGEEHRLAGEALARWERAHGPASDAPSRRRAFAALRRLGYSATAARAALFSPRESG